MKFGRLILGALIIGIALWVIVGEQLAGASANALVNARLNTLRAPVAGTIAMPERALGAAVAAGEELATVSDPLVDTIRFNDLAMELAFETAEAARLEAEIAATEALREALADRTTRFSRERVEELEVRLHHARERLRLLEEGATEGRLGEFLDEGQSGSVGDPRLPEIALEYARERVAVLEIALRAARDGVFLGDGYNDAPNAEQRRVELETLLSQMRASHAKAEARIAAVAARVDHERLRVNRFSGASLASTVNGLVWEVLAADGEVVQRGQDVMRLLDCSSTVVTLSVTESIFNSLNVGDAAVFRPMGESRRMDGTVIRLAGSGAETIYRNLAVAPTQRHLERYDVALLVPELRRDASLSCAVGKTGRAFFDRRPLDAIRTLRFW